ncbi:MAG TPA: FAD-dependent oxidoreductase [Caulobacteraceae bacterium]
MARLSGMRVAVAGAGAIGSAIALKLQDEGAKVLLADPAPAGPNASRVAAGMLAPALEAVLDRMAADHFPLLRAARDLWPALAERLVPFGARLDRSGALWVGDEASNAAALAGLIGIGAEAEALATGPAQGLSQGLEAPAGAVFTAEDWTLDPGPMLAALHAAFEAEGGALRLAAIRGWRQGRAQLSDAGAAEADVLVLAAGLEAEDLAEAPPELVHLEPIKGQLIRLDGAAPRSGPVVRGEGIYVAPRASGAIAGATMEPGRRDLEVEPATVDRLRAAAARLFPALATASAIGAAGVRAGTPDGLPLVGPSRTPGMWLAMGARRNGWLLALLIAETIADQLAGEAGGRFARLFDPARF